MGASFKGKSFMTHDSKIGARIQMFRGRNELTVDQLAQNAGLDPALVRAIEAGKTQPPIGVLIKLARALGQRLGTFMDGVASNDPVVSKLGADDTDHDTPGKYPQIYHYVPLAADKIDRHMQPLYIELNPADANTPMSSHEGEEFMLVLDGTLEVMYGPQTRLLKKGDTIYYDAVVPHRVAAAPGTTAKVCAVVYEPI